MPPLSTPTPAPLRPGMRPPSSSSTCPSHRRLHPLCGTTMRSVYIEAIFRRYVLIVYASLYVRKDEEFVALFRL